MFENKFAIAIVIIIVLIICAILFYRSDYFKRFLAETYEAAGESGPESTKVRRAVTELRNLGAPRADDRFRLARLISTNLVDDAPADVQQQLREETAREYMEFLNDDNAMPHRTQLDIIRDFGTHLDEDAALQRAIDLSVRGKHANVINKELENENKGTSRFRKLINRANDKQNVHDSAVLNNSKKVVAKIGKTKNKTTQGTGGNEDAAEYAERLRTIVGGNPRAQKVVDSIRKLATPMSAYDGKTESQILEDTVNRIWHPNNEGEHRDNMIENMRANLVDCLSENGNLTCATGRVQRMLQSLTLNDFEQRDTDALGGTLEDYKNEIFRECNKTLNESLKNEAPEELYALHKGKVSYADFYDDEENVAMEKEFNEKMRRKFDAIVDGYKDRIPKHQLGPIKTDTYAAIE